MNEMERPYLSIGNLFKLTCIIISMSRVIIWTYHPAVRRVTGTTEVLLQNEIVLVPNYFSVSRGTK